MSETTERTYTTVDKTGWADGPWMSEPDKVQWLDEATGYDCLVVRGPSGALCGYVGLPPEHPCHGVDYDRIVVPRPGGLRVHGGLTYADHCQEGDDEAVGICHVPLPGRSDNVWWLGFDCAHLHDLTPKYERTYHGFSDVGDVYRSLAYVRGEVVSLAAQLVNATPQAEAPDGA